MDSIKIVHDDKSPAIDMTNTQIGQYTELEICGDDLNLLLQPFISTYGILNAMLCAWIPFFFIAGNTASQVETCHKIGHHHLDSPL